ncbi:MAG: NAD(P)H-binding protein [Leptolyngbya sp.]|nr:NAD(P)H-binding protein [Candidatus Melainabacteria bacterium]
MIVVTTPTGKIGRQVLNMLLEAKADVRVIVRSAAKLSPELRDQVDVIEGSHGDLETIDKALQGAEALFWLPPPNPKAESLESAYRGFARPAAQAIEKHGVKHVVSVSALGRGLPIAAHAGLVTASHEMDDELAASGAAFRALTMPSFMDNLLWQVQSIKTTHLLRSTIDPNLQLPTCATCDIAERATELLCERNWIGRADSPVLGPADLSFDWMAATMSEVLGLPVRYEQVSLDSHRVALQEQGMSPAMVQGIVDMMAAKNKGLDSAEPRNEQSSSRTTFRQWCETQLKPAVENASGGNK